MKERERSFPVKREQSNQEREPILTVEALLESIRQGEGTVTGAQVQDLTLTDSLLEERIFPLYAPEELSFYNVIFANCRWSGCRLDGCSFIDAFFQSGDFSNSSFSGSYWKNCRWQSGKWMGVNLSESSVQQGSMENVNLQYGNFSASSLKNLKLTCCDLSQGDLSQCTLKELNLTGCRLSGCNFFKTPLRGVDFSENLLEGPILSDRYQELRGAVVNADQAAELARLLGVVIRD